MVMMREQERYVMIRRREKKGEKMVMEVRKKRDKWRK